MAKRKAGKQGAKEAKRAKPTEQAPEVAQVDPEIANTLYVHNLNDQVSVGDLRTTLYMLFSIYGHLVAVNAHKSPKMRGQAHVVFARPEAAATALAKLEGQIVFDKPLKLAYAKTRSHKLQKLDSQAHFAANSR